MNTELIYTGTPFREPLRLIGESANLHTLPSSPNRYIRNSSPHHGLVEHIVGRSLFHELDESYGIPVVRTQIVAGFYPQLMENTVYSITEVIKGENLYELPLNWYERNVTGPILFDKFLTTLATYYQDKLTRGGYYLWDLSSENFVYDRTPSDRRKRICLVDVDPWFNLFKPEELSPEDNNNLFLATLGLCTQIEDFEEKLGTRKLRRARSALYKLLVSSIHSPALSPHFLQGDLDLRKKAQELLTG